MQSDFAAKVLQRHGIDPKDLDTFHVVENYDQPDERVLQRSDAILRAGRELGGLWDAGIIVAQSRPRPLRDLVYRFVAHKSLSRLW